MRILLILVVLFSLTIVSCGDGSKDADQGPVETTSIDTSLKPTQAPTVVNTYAPVDVSPMDMSYFPADYPKLKMTNSGMAEPVIRIVYSRPHLQNRRLFPSILKFDETWRLGANESTEIDFYKKVTIQGKSVNPGRYILYSIPHEKTWSILLNSNIDTWGLKQDSTKDVQRFEIPVTLNNPKLEYFTLVFEKSATGADLVIAWDDFLARLPIQF